MTEPTTAASAGPMGEPESMSMLGFVDEFKRIHDSMPNRRFAFILGAGASKSSGIKLASEMVADWVSILHRRSGEGRALTASEWATDTKLGIEHFNPSDPAASYSALYRRMYASDPDQGYAYLEQEMAKAEPSYGYSVLGRIMADYRHRAVITVNFDNLVADSLSIFSKTYPLVCGHESLSQFARTDLRRPLVLKVHRDLLLKPMSDPDELSRVDDGLKHAITGLLGQYTPIVIGYGGNDDSLMACLESIDSGHVPGGIYWCYREGGSPPPLRIRSLVAKHRGFLVPHLGFDELMELLGRALGMERPEKQLMKRAKERAKNLRQQLERLTSRLEERASQEPIVRTTPTDQARSTRPVVPGNLTTQGRSDQNNEGTVAELEAVLRSVHHSLGKSGEGKPWWQWQREAASEPDTEKRDAIYRAAIEALPDSRELLGNYATYLRNVREDYAKAEHQYKRALEIDPKAAINLGNYATFLTDVRKDHAKAEELFERSLAADPRNAVNLGNYATFLMDVRKDRTKAGQLFERSLESDPTNALNLGNYAVLLTDLRKDRAKAEQLYKRALEADPTSATDLGNYARLLLSTGQVDKGLATLDLAFANLTDEYPATLVAECWMYAFCCRPPGAHAEALAHLKQLIERDSVRTGEWDFSGVIAAAVERGHPDAEWLTLLADVLAGREDVSRLADWEAWRAA